MKKILTIIVLIFIVIIFSFYWKYSNFKTTSLTQTEEIIEIKKWETFYSLSQKLHLNTTLLKIYLKLNPPSFWFQAGEYKIVEKSNIWEIIKQLQTPLNKDEKITILEWWNIYDIDNYLTEKKLIHTWDFIENFWEYEGLFYPDTYYINPNNFSVEKFAKRMMKHFDTEVRNNLPSKYQTKKWLKDLLILSSIVEKEANSEDNPEEIAIIAWILKKRMKENWFIGADATTCYPHKITHKECNPTFINKHINDNNPYNLRKNLWLPPTPIGNPSYKTIEATLNSKKSPYYYYLHDNTWQIHYGITNADHLRNKNMYIK